MNTYLTMLTITYGTMLKGEYIRFLSQNVTTGLEMASQGLFRV